MMELSDTVNILNAKVIELLESLKCLELSDIETYLILSTKAEILALRFSVASTKGKRT